MERTYYLVVLETSGNQSYVYGTNKLKENVGGSELIRRSTTDWVFKAISELCSRACLKRQDSQAQKDALCNSSLNPPIEAGETGIEVVEAISGKAILLAENEMLANDLIFRVTSRAITEAPGLSIVGAKAPFAWEGSYFPDVLGHAYDRYETLRGSISGTELLSQRLPIVADCVSSSLPAAAIDDEKRPVSSSVQSKRHVAQDVFDNGPRVELEKKQYRFAWDLEDEDRVAVIHADGNGLGDVFSHFDKHCTVEGNDLAARNRDYVNKLRTFSCAIDVCTHKAFDAAAKDLVAFMAVHTEKYDAYLTKGILPLRSLVLAGDDMTVFCRADLALEFTAKYLQHFEEETALCQDIQPIARSMTRGKFAEPWLSACAGVAIIKGKYPFFAGYQLAEELCSSAKESKKALRFSDTRSDGASATAWSWPCSALDFHVLHDSSAVKLDDIRKRLTLENDDGKTKTRLFGAPYVVTATEKYPPELSNDHEGTKEWLEHHNWAHVTDAVAILSCKGKDGARALPNSQVHTLRAALFGGSAAADAALRLITRRYPKLKDLMANDKKISLFVDDSNPATTGSASKLTYLLDAMEASDFLPQPETQKEGPNEVHA